MRILRTLLIGIVILWGLLALLVRAATPFVADYRDQIAALAAERLGVPVSIGRLTSRWYGLSPLLEFHRVRIGDRAPELIEIDRLSIDLTPAELLSGSLVDALRLTVDGVELTMIREPTGQLHLQGIGTLTPAHAERHGPVALPSHIRSVNTRVVWIDRKAGTGPLPIDDLAVVLDREGSLLKLRASLQTASGKADLTAELDGLLTGTKWSGETYLRVAGLDVANLFARYLPPHYGLHGLTLNLESWSQWQDALPQHSQGGFRLRGLDLQPLAEGSLPLKIAEASARYSFSRTPQGMRAGIKDLQLAFADHRWPAGDLALELNNQADGSRRIEAAADYVRIDDIVRVLQVRLPWRELQVPLDHLRPAGQIHDLRLTVHSAADRLDWRARARFDGIAISPWERLPGVERLSGMLHAQPDHLVLELDSRDAKVRFERLFRDPLAVQLLRGRVDLVRDHDAWHVRSDELHAVTPHIRTRSRLQLDWPHEGPSVIDMQTDFADGDAAFASRYYPVGVMSDALVGWLDNSIKSGQVVGGSLLLYGPLNHFPFAARSNGTFEVAFDTRDVELDYRAGWPKLEQVDAHVRFHGNELDIALVGARIHDSQVVDASARIESLRPVTPIRIRGRVVGPLADNLRVLQSDALRPRYGHIAAAVRGEGQTELALDFTIPLAGHGQPGLNGELKLDKARLSLPEWQLAMSDVSGTIAFTLDGVTARAVKARALNAPVVVDLLPLTNGTTRVQTRGNFTLDAIRRQLPFVPLPFLGGAADFTVNVDLPGAGAAAGTPTGLSVESDLKGISVDLPAPFGKTPAQSRTLVVYLPITGRTTPGRVEYAGQVSARFSADGERIDVLLGGGQAKLRSERGLRIGGHLPALDVAAWGPVLAALPSGTDDSRPPLTLDLRIDRLLADTVTIRRLRFTATHSHQAWRGGVDAQNLAGSFVVPDDSSGTPLTFDLQRLAIRLPPGGDEVTIPPLPDVTAGPDPAKLPGVALSITDLRVNDARLGRLQLNAQSGSEGLRITELSLREGLLELDSAGYWARDSKGYRTHLGGRVSTENLGNLLVALGYSRQVEDAGGNAEFLLQWPGHPAQFHRATLEGKIGLDVGRGRLVELDPGVTRVVGLLNLNALTRRLRLDFSDFYKKGYSFDSIKGDLKFNRGTALVEGLSVLGPTGRIDVEGSADLMARTLDQKVGVTPNLDATLPIAGTLAGGPVAGIAVLVAQKVMTKQVDKLNRFEYSISGPWTQPDVKQLDTGGTLSKILQPFSGGDKPVAEAHDASQPPAEPGVPDEPSQPAAEPAPETPPTDATAPAEAPASAAEVDDETPGVLRGLIDILKKGEPHGADLPGSQN